MNKKLKFLKKTLFLTCIFCFSSVFASNKINLLLSNVDGSFEASAIHGVQIEHRRTSKSSYEILYNFIKGTSGQIQLGPNVNLDGQSVNSCQLLIFKSEEDGKISYQVESGQAASPPSVGRYICQIAGDSENPNISVQFVKNSHG